MWFSTLHIGYRVGVALSEQAIIGAKLKDIYEAHKLYEKKKKREEYEAMIKGMSRAAKHWGRMGAQKRREGFHPLGLKKAGEWFAEEKLFFDDSEENNRRKAHCKICGKQLVRGEGHRIIIYAPNWYNLSFYFGCEECKDKLEITTLRNRTSSG